MPVLDIQWADSLSREWVEQNVDLRAARLTGKDPQWFPRPSRRDTPAQWTGVEGMWRMDWQGQCAVLLRVPVLCAQPSEREWEWAINYPETQVYIGWMKQGYMPPPVCLTRYESGGLAYVNRRRWLAARAAGVESWLVWYWGYCHEERFCIGRWWLPEWSGHYVADYHHRLSVGMDPAKTMDKYVYRRLVRAGIAA